MSKLNISSLDGATFAANLYLDYGTKFTATEKAKVLPDATYNVGVVAFDISTLLVVKAIVAVVFANFTAAVALGVAGYCLRKCANHIFHNWYLTREGITSMASDAVDKVTSVFTGKDESKENDIVSFDDIVLVKNFRPLKV
jgi:hypothetical protein